MEIYKNCGLRHRINPFLLSRNLSYMLSKRKFEKIIATSSNSSHKSLKKNKSSLILNSKTTKLNKTTRLLDVVRKISNQKAYSNQLNTSNEYSCLENEEDGDDDIILVEPNEIEKEVDILIDFNSIQLKDEGLVRLIKETLHGNDSDLVDIFENSISSFVEMYTYSKNNS